MELSKKLEISLNKHINEELYSAYLYLSMSAYCEASNLAGFSHWLMGQHQEEISHAMKLFDFVNDRGGRVILQAIEQPPVEFASPMDVMEQTLAHERKVTSLIHRLYELSVEESDYPAQVLLHWFVSEQVEEEKAASEIVDQLRLAGENAAALMLIDSKLGARIFEEGAK